MGGRLTTCLAGRRAEANAEELRDLRRLWLMLMRGTEKDPRHADNGRLSWAEFQLAFGVGWNAMLVKRVFDVIDREGRGALTCDEFVHGLAPLACMRPNPTEKLQFVFRCFDLDGSGTISHEELLVCLRLFTSQVEARDDLWLSNAQLEQVAACTLRAAQLDENGHISWKEFQRLVRARSGLGEHIAARFGLNVNKMIAQLIMARDFERLLRPGVREPELLAGNGAAGGPLAENRPLPRPPPREEDSLRSSIGSVIASPPVKRPSGDGERAVRTRECTVIVP